VSQEVSETSGPLESGGECSGQTVWKVEQAVKVAVVEGREDLSEGQLEQDAEVEGRVDARKGLGASRGHTQMCGSARVGHGRPGASTRPWSGSHFGTAPCAVSRWCGIGTQQSRCKWQPAGAGRAAAWDCIRWVTDWNAAYPAVAVRQRGLL
jgi:hypothetical protein